MRSSPALYLRQRMRTSTALRDGRGDRRFRLRLRMRTSTSVYCLHSRLGEEPTLQTAHAHQHTMWAGSLKLVTAHADHPTTPGRKTVACNCACVRRRGVGQEAASPVPYCARADLETP
ncbi:hypothetical protein NDU88_000096 [Pleurodeles waltl]|uniref:Uncharacterized protein n=1 Tax=Pleurodeles waltl TaxID=8319 RepID=A0AAV7U3M0_PLEWA|nr:hypothetical protein NDU88_000096 [Pleurodeles waltl]